MSQTETIYNFMSQTQNPAADGALLMGLRRAKEPYRTTILQSILAGGRTDGTAELVRNFHTYPQHWQDILSRKAQKLHHGLRQAANETNSQAQLNALAIIKNSQYGRLTDLVATLLRENQPQVAQTAGEVLTLLGVTHAPQIFGQCGELFEQTNPNSYHPYQRDQWVLLSVIEAAVRNYKLHRRWEAVFAAMCLVPATVDRFWKNQLESYHVVGKVVRNILTNTARAELIPFAMSALAVSDLRSTIIRSLTHHTRPDYLAAMALYVADNQDETINYSLSQLKRPRWLDPLIAPPGRIDAKAQIALVDLVMIVGATEEQKTQYLAAVCEEGTEDAGLKALEALTTLPYEFAQQAYRRAAGSRHEAVALKAIEKLIARKNPQLRRFLAQQLKSPHSSVRDLARSTLKSIILESYWRNFDTLNNEKQRKAGLALYKIDPELARQQWIKQAGMASPLRRLKAIRMATLLDRVEPDLETILRLTDDTDDKVRSCAIAALGHIEPEAATVVQPYIIKALDDKNMRVRANAVEALEKLDLRDTAQIIKPFVESSDNRLRANTIKTLLNWKEGIAKNAIQKMMSDSDTKHRRSGLWVLKQTQSLLNIPKILKKKLAENPHAASTVMAK